MTEISATAPDGYPVHGWLMTPPGPGPHPVLLLIHGGPDWQFQYQLFDEAQVYASRYAVVLANPRGSAGYGEAHARAIKGRLGTVDADDLMALFDVGGGAARHRRVARRRARRLLWGLHDRVARGASRAALPRRDLRARASSPGTACSAPATSATP